MNLGRVVSILIKNGFRLSSEGGEGVFLDLRNGGKSHFYIYTLISLSASGRVVYLKGNLKYLAGVSDLDGRLLRNFKIRIYLINGRSPDISDWSSSMPKMCLSNIYNNPEISADSKLPLLMHPEQYLYPNVKTTCKTSSTVKRNRLKILFAGNCNRETYDKDHFKSRFGIDNRYVIINYILNSAGHKLSNLRTARQFSIDYFNRVSLDLVIWDSGPESDSFRVERIPPSMWLRKLSEYDFFLALPGSSVPVCHNVVEAMSVGVVPILNYQNYIVPKLIPDLNCIAFEKCQDLPHIFQRIEQLSESKLSELSAQSFNTFSEFLTLAKYSERLLDPNKENGSTLHVFNETLL